MNDSPKSKAETLIGSIKKRSSIKDPSSEAFRKTGVAAASIIEAAFKSQGINLNSGMSVLDFGAGSGRVALPLTELNPQMRLTVTDVDAESIEFLSLSLPKHCHAEVGGYLPPTSFEDGAFDAVYAISVWSHFPEDQAVNWLREIRRISRHGAILVITVAGKCVLEKYKHVRPWSDISVEEYERDKFVYREYPFVNSNDTSYPGISGKGSWGVTAIHPDYIREKWAEFFEVRDIKPCGMNGQQDLVILANNK